MISTKKDQGLVDAIYKYLIDPLLLLYKIFHAVEPEIITTTDISKQVYIGKLK